MKWIIIILTGLIISSCNSSSFEKIELISAYGRVLNYNETDSMILAIIIRSYAQIDKNGNCNIIKKNGQNKKDFYSFKIDPDLINTINNRLSKINSDTALTEKSDGIYDGPAIELWVHKNDGRKNRLVFIDSKRTDKDFLKLYKYIDSINHSNDNRRYIDTLKLLSDQDILINIMKEESIKSGHSFGRDSIVIIK
jgi:hypothetical protein